MDDTNNNDNIRDDDLQNNNNNHDIDDIRWNVCHYKCKTSRTIGAQVISNVISTQIIVTIMMIRTVLISSVWHKSFKIVHG